MAADGVTGFRHDVFGCEVGIRFPTVKLLDFTAREAELEASVNPFAKMVLAHLAAKQTRGDPASRHASKMRLVRGLYDGGLSAKDVRELFRLIDWLIALPPPLEEAFRFDLEKFQQERHMPYVTSIERSYRREGMRKGIRSLLKVKFGDEGLKMMAEIENVHDDEQLDAIVHALETANGPADVRRLMMPATP